MAFSWWAMSIAGRRCLLDGASRALAAVLGEVAEQAFMSLERRPVDDVSAGALLRHQPGIGELLQVERQRVRRDVQGLGHRAGVRPLLPATTSARKTSRRTGWASAASERITSVCSIIRGYWNYRTVASSAMAAKSSNARSLCSLACARMPAGCPPAGLSRHADLRDGIRPSFSTYTAPSIPHQKVHRRGQVGGEGIGVARVDRVDASNPVKGVVGKEIAVVIFRCKLPLAG